MNCDNDAHPRSFGVGGLVRGVHDETRPWVSRVDPDVLHTIQADVNSYDVSPDMITFEGGDFPYLRLALLDRYLEEVAEESYEM